MPAPARHEPGESDGILKRASSLVQETADKYRQTNRFAKMRGAIAGAWILLAAVTLWGACPSSGPTNPLGADVQVLRDSLVGGQQILVRNESSSIWTGVKLTLDGSWHHERNTIRPHDQLILSIPQFRRDGEPAPWNLTPRSLAIECEQGRYVITLQ
jgi:hypothetical protein